MTGGHFSPYGFLLVFTEGECDDLFETLSCYVTEGSGQNTVSCDDMSGLQVLVPIFLL